MGWVGGGGGGGLNTCLLPLFLGLAGRRSHEVDVPGQAVSGYHQLDDDASFVGGEPRWAANNTSTGPRRVRT